MPDYFCTTCRDTGAFIDSDEHDCPACGGESSFKRDTMRLVEGFVAASKRGASILDGPSAERLDQQLAGRRDFFEAPDLDRPLVLKRACQVGTPWAWASGVMAESEAQRRGDTRPCGRSIGLCQLDECPCKEKS